MIVDVAPPIATARTLLFGVVGDPVSHSLSPLIHNLWMAQHGIDAVYGALNLRSPQPADDLRALARAGYAGLNVTLPHKQAALAAAATVSPEAQRIGAANTLKRESDGTWSAYNTDIAGFSVAFAEAMGNRVKGAGVVVVGAGGSARAVVAHLKEAGARLAIVNRTKANADALARDLAPDAETGDMSRLAIHANNADAVVNAASLGHAGATLDLPPHGGVFFDLSYGKAAVPMIEAARNAGWAAHDGLPMLVAQAAEAFHIWFGVSPDRAAALSACRVELQSR
jgi:shikimate dehydrogenase